MACLTSFLLCFLFIAEVIGNPVIFTNRVTGLRQQIPHQFLPSNFKDFPDVDYLFLPDLSHDFDAFDYDSVPLDSTGNSFFPSNEFNSKRSREHDEMTKINSQNIIAPNEIISNNKEKEKLKEFSTQTVSTFQQPPNVLINKPVAKEPSRSDLLLASIIGGIKKDIFKNQPIHNRIQQNEKERTNNFQKPSRDFPVALHVSESISAPSKVVPLENANNLFHPQQPVSRSKNLLSMIVKGIQKDIFPNENKRINLSPQTIPKSQSFVQEPQFFRPGRKNIILEAKDIFPNENKGINLSPQTIPKPQSFVQEPQFFRPGRKNLIPEAKDMFPNENKRINVSPQTIPKPQSSVQEPQFLRPVRRNFILETNDMFPNENKRINLSPQTIPQPQSSINQKPQFFRPVRRNLILEASPSINFEHRVVPERLEQFPVRREQVLQRQNHFQENRQQFKTPSRSQLLLGNIMSSIQRDIFDRKRFI